MRLGRKTVIIGSGRFHIIPLALRFRRSLITLHQSSLRGAGIRGPRSCAERVAHPHRGNSPGRNAAGRVLFQHLAEKYGDRPVAELPLLFHRITQNAIRDWFRRQKVRSLWTTLLSSLTPNREDDEQDPLETLEVADDSQFSLPPAEQLAQSQVIGLIEKALETLPARQRQAFLLRYWEELDVAEAAKVMGCSEGSVKTHCSRATHALAALLEKQGIKL